MCPQKEVVVAIAMHTSTNRQDGRSRCYRSRWALLAANRCRLSRRFVCVQLQEGARFDHFPVQGSCRAGPSGVLRLSRHLDYLLPSHLSSWLWCVPRYAPLIVGYGWCGSMAPIGLSGGEGGDRMYECITVEDLGDLGF